MEYFDKKHPGYYISTDREKMDAMLIHQYLSKESYWSPGIPLAIVEKSIRNSLCFGIFDSQGQVGFARIVSDCATFAYLADVFILEKHRGQGLSKWLMEVIVSHPDLQGLRRWMLGTLDAHRLYEKFGFMPLANPARFMERHFPDVYQNKVS